MWKVGFLLIGAFIGQITQANEAINEWNANRLDSAKGLFTQQLAEANAKPTALYYLANIEALQGRYDAAMSLVDQGLAINSENAKLYLVQGKIYGSQAMNASVFSMLGLAKKCLHSYEEAYRRDAKDVEVLEALIDYHTMAPSIAGGSQTQRDKYIAELVAVNAERGLMKKIAANAKNEDLSLQLAKELNAKKPSDPLVVYALGHFYKEKKQFAQAETLLSQVVTMVNSPAPSRDARWSIVDAYLQLGETYMEQGQSLDKGIQLIGQYHQLNQDRNDPHYFWSYYSLAKLYKAKNELIEYKRLVDTIKQMDYKKNKYFADVFERETRH